MLAYEYVLFHTTQSGSRCAINYDDSLLFFERNDDGVEACESFILLNHVHTGNIVPVCLLELAVLLEDGRYLLLATDYNLFAQTLEILLVALLEGVQERIGLFLMYHDGSLNHVSVYDSCIEFSYFSTEVWRLSVSKKKRYCFPPRGWWALLVKNQMSVILF